jgi:hypothetical protein
MILERHRSVNLRMLMKLVRLHHMAESEKPFWKLARCVRSRESYIIFTMTSSSLTTGNGEHSVFNVVGRDQIHHYTYLPPGEHNS